MTRRNILAELHSDGDRARGQEACGGWECSRKPRRGFDYRLTAPETRETQIGSRANKGTAPSLSSRLAARGAVRGARGGVWCGAARRGAQGARVWVPTGINADHHSNAMAAPTLTAAGSQASGCNQRNATQCADV